MLRLCKSFIDRIIALFGVTMVGSQSNEDGNVNENGKKPIGLECQNSNTLFLYILLQDYDVKMPYFTFYHEDVNTRQRLSFLFPEL